MILRIFSLAQIKRMLEENDIEYFVEDRDMSFKGFSSLYRSEPETLTWARDRNADLNIQAKGVICPLDTPEAELLQIRVKYPEYAFATILSYFDYELSGITLIHGTAKLGKNVQLGHNVVVGPYCHIDGNVSVGHNVVLVRDVDIGKDSRIQSGTVIGEPGFSRAVAGEKTRRWPHLAGVTIGERVEISSNVTIDRGVLYNTEIGDDVMIDNLVHIAHNCKIGARTMITASVEISGSVEIGQDCWLAPGAIVRDQVKIGNNVLVGLGAVVTKDIPAGVRVMGIPARVI